MQAVDRERPLRLRSKKVYQKRTAFVRLRSALQLVEKANRLKTTA